MHYALARWEDIRSIAAEREVVAVWLEDDPATWIAFRVDAVRAVGHWAGRDQVDTGGIVARAFFIMDVQACANVAANLRANGLHLCRTYRNRSQIDPALIFPVTGIQ